MRPPSLLALAVALALRVASGAVTPVDVTGWGELLDEANALRESGPAADQLELRQGIADVAIAPHQQTEPAAAVDASGAAGTSDGVVAEGNAGGEAGEAAAGPWAKVVVADVPEGSDSLAATVDEGGAVHLAPSASSGSSNLAAWGSFSDTLDELGWSGLSMHLAGSDSGVGDDVKMYAAGVIEGFLTAKRIKEFQHNSRALLLMSSDNQQRLPSLEAGLARSVQELAAASRTPEFLQASTSPFDTQAKLAFLQTWGVRDGYELARSRKAASLSGAGRLSMVDMMLINSDGVVDELMTKYGGPAQGAGASLLEERVGRVLRRGANPRGRGRDAASAGVLGFQPRRRGLGHCTAVARLTEDKQELYFGHTTWEAYSEMTRIWKVYDFPLKNVAAKKISFSSYPGCVSSTDDYYLMDSGLAVTETTLNLPGEQHYDSSAFSLPDFLRIMASNRVASSGRDWVDSMVQSATGTYSSQWLVVDYNKFSPGSDLPEGTFHVLEQVPGVSHFEDMSASLQKDGYWASYDRAYFDDVRQRSGDNDLEAKLRRAPAGSELNAQAALYSKTGTPRAQIVGQTARGVGSLESMREEMTRNHGREEPVEQAALREPWFTISARSDLQDKDHINKQGSPDGGVDSKVTSSCLFRSLSAEAISSPSHRDMPPFSWTSEDGREVWPGYPHEGLPNTANFDWVRVETQDQMLSSLSGDGACH